MDLDLTKRWVADLSSKEGEMVAEVSDNVAVVSDMSVLLHARCQEALEESRRSSEHGGSQRVHRNNGFGFIFGNGRKPL